MIGYKVGGHTFSTVEGGDRIECESCKMAYRDFLRNGGGCVLVTPGVR